MATQLFNQDFSNQFLAIDPTVSGNGLRAASSDDTPLQFLISDDGAGFLKFAVANSDLCLDIYGDDNIKPYLASCGDAAGQQWWRTGDKLSNSFTGEGFYLDLYSDTKQAFMSEGDFSGQYWQEIQVELQKTDPTPNSGGGSGNDPINAKGSSATANSPGTSTATKSLAASAMNAHGVATATNAQVASVATDTKAAPTTTKSRGGLAASTQMANSPALSSSSTRSSSASSASSGLSVATKAGIGVGVAVGAAVAILLAVLVFMMKKRKVGKPPLVVKHHPYGFIDNEQAALSQLAFGAGETGVPSQHAIDRRSQNAFVETQFGEKIPLHYSSASTVPMGVSQMEPVPHELRSNRAMMGNPRAEPQNPAHEKYLIGNGRWI